LNITTGTTFIRLLGTAHRFMWKAIITKDIIHTKTLLEYRGRSNTPVCLICSEPTQSIDFTIRKII